MPVTGPMTSATNNQFEDANLPRNTVHEVSEVPVVAVKYTDGFGKTQTRLSIMVNGQPFLLSEDISSGAKATQKWFSKQVNEKLYGIPPREAQGVPVTGMAEKTIDQGIKEAPAINVDAM